MSVTRLPPSSCTGCGRLMDAAGTMGADDDSEPSPGDLTICIDCGTVMQFDADYSLKPVTIEMIMQMSPEERNEFGRMKATVAAYLRWRRRNRDP